MSFDAITNFLSTDIGDYFIKIATVIVVIVIFIVIIVKGIRKHRRIIKLRRGEMPSIEIMGKVASIEYVKKTGENSSRIAGRYFIAEGVNPFTNVLCTYSSEQYAYDGDKVYIKIGDPVKIFVSVENSNDYYLQDVVSAKVAPSLDKIIINTIASYMGNRTP